MNSPKTQGTLPIRGPMAAHLVTTDFPPSYGGLENYAFQLATQLEAVCEISASLGILAPPKGLATDRKWHWHRGRKRLQAGLWSSWDSLANIQRVSCRIHMQWNTAMVSAWQRRTKKLEQLWICAHGAELIQNNRILHALMLEIMKQADGIVTGSQYTAHLLEQFGVAKSKIRINPYGVDIPQVRDAPSPRQDTQNWRLICTHRFVARKGTELLFQSLAELKSIPWQLDLIGTGDEFENLQRLAFSLGCKNRIHFLGAASQDEKIETLYRSHLLILPSLPPIGNNHIEGLGIGLLEAQAQGIPVLGANTGGIPEAIQVPSTGQVFDAGSQASLTKSLVGLYEMFSKNPRAYAAMGEAGQIWVKENFTWEKNLDRWRDWLQA